MPLARRRGESGMNYWPGFVDALSTLVLSIVFLLTVFVVVQFYLQQEVAGKDTALTNLNAQIAELTSLLSLEKAGKSDLEGQLAALRATLSKAKRRNFPPRSKARRRSPPERWRRSRRSTNRSPRCAVSSPQSSKRSTPPSRRTRNRRAASPTLVSASTWRWRRRCKS